jgi:hypothetical protein
MEMNKIKVIIKRPGEMPETQTIPNELEALQTIVGGYIETVTLATDLVIICNEEGKLLDLPYNCDICGASFVGTIIFAGINGDEFADVPMDAVAFNALFGENNGTR